MRWVWTCVWTRRLETVHFEADSASSNRVQDAHFRSDA